MRIKNLIAVFLIAFSLGGCASGDMANRFNLFTSIQNPISVDDFYYVKTAYAALALPVANYRELPLCKKSKPFSITNICAKRSVIVKLQELDARAYEALTVAEEYIASNQTVNLASVISAAKIAVLSYKKYATDNGVTI